ncbi:hypothetical protein CI109_100053 [Kwoniella shandongensis]|uniref:NmrA-like domain-containing protein n=1 Tax=Kwoniella shandongensis TaxID=1734106 RepID=A0A5M6BS46_9TREE|nr:uncharacterized protein CI109_005974 [Kwoniella shandongensis]KAA5525666.1 hypothetical protein CI109_005974 [Kwoniella shandongensis]
MTKSILLIGAGELGLAILETLLEHPSKPEITVLLRPSSNTDLSSYGTRVRVLHGDISLSVEELAALFEEFEVIVSAIGFTSGPGSQLKLAKAVLQSQGVKKHYVPWQFGVDYDTIGRGSSQPLFDEQLDVRDLLRSQSQDQITWTIISTGLFTSFLFNPAFGVVDFHPDKKAEKTKKVTVTALGSWDNKLTITSAENIGLFTNRILLDHSEPEEGVIFVGDDTVTFGTLAQVLEEKGWQVEKRLATVEELENDLRQNTEDVGARYKLVWARGRGVAWDLDECWNKRNRVETGGVAEWIERNLK